jgi:hypothetical protein
MEIIWTDRVRNEELLHRVKEHRNILHTIDRRKANWIGHILCFNCLLKHVIERKIEGMIEVVTGKRGRRRNQLLGDFNKKRGYFKLKREAIVPTLWGTRCGRGYGSVVRHYRMHACNVGLCQPSVPISRKI